MESSSLCLAGRSKAPSNEAVGAERARLRCTLHAGLASPAGRKKIAHRFIGGCGARVAQVPEGGKNSTVPGGTPLVLGIVLLAFLLAGCGRSDKGLSFLPPWPRPHYQAGGSNALVFYVMYGRFQPGAEVSAKTYRTAGFPPGLDLRYLTRDKQPEFPFVNDLFAKTAGETNSALFAQVKSAPECLIFEGTVPDPHDLNYLRDLAGLIMFSLDHGAIAVLDVQQLKLYDPAAWRAEIFQPQPPVLTHQAVILVSDEPDGTRWLHTRGMRKFGRPDLSLHHVSQTNQTAVTELFNRFILLEAQGGLISEGREVQMADLPPGLACHHAGTLDDPDFNNVHVELRWPAHN
jgi:hypothetical protein